MKLRAVPVFILTLALSWDILHVIAVTLLPDHFSRLDS